MSMEKKMNPNAKSFFPNKNTSLNIMEVYVNPITKQKVIFNENVVNKPHTKLYLRHFLC